MIASHKEGRQLNRSAADNCRRFAGCNTRWTECNSGIGVEYPQNINIGATFNRTVAFLAGRGTGVGCGKRVFLWSHFHIGL